MIPPVYNNPVEFGKVNLEMQSSTPIEVFKAVANFDELVSHIILPESQRYAMQQGEVFQTNAEEITAFLDICIIMGYNKLPNMRCYWSTEADLYVDAIASTMTRRRFEVIRKHIHFNNNENQMPAGDENHDRACKIRPVINHLNKSFSKVVEIDEAMAIDYYGNIWLSSKEIIP